LPELKDKSIGIILYFRFPRSIKYLILKHRKGHWSFPKGHKEQRESAIQTAKRELYEEAAVNEIDFLSKRILLTEKYNFINRSNRKVRKEVDYFIASSKNKKVKIDKKEIINYKWCTLKGADKVLTYKQSKKILKKASVFINKKSIPEKG
ncbi:MAG: NUDIX domain-containing protein, partial [Ignavibacteria bacterium]